jgi:threonine dehydrogenase-like Zn-dependent dehydrogenase
MRHGRPSLQLILDANQPSAVMYRITLDRAPDYYRIFGDKKDNCLKTVIKF